MRLVGQQEGHPACKKTESWGALPFTFSLPFLYRLTQVVLEKTPLNGCSSGVVDFSSVLILTRSKCKCKSLTCMSESKSKKSDWSLSLGVESYNSAAIEWLQAAVSSSHSNSFHKLGSSLQRSANVCSCVFVVDDTRRQSEFNSSSRRARRSLYVTKHWADNFDLLKETHNTRVKSKQVSMVTPFSN